MTHSVNLNSEPQGQQPPILKDTNILGLSTDGLAGLTLDELEGNKTAITMVMHYYKQLVDENNTLRNEVNTLKTYVDGYSRKKTNANISAVLLLLSNIGIGFGINLLTNGTNWPGLATLIPGLCFALAGLYFSFKEN